MTSLLQHVEIVRRRMTEIAERELALVRALGEALKTVDQKLLHDVQAVTAEHEARRGAILGELQDLATRIGAFPMPREAVAEREVPGYLTDETIEHGNGRGDWRQAAKNIDSDLEFGVDFDLSRRAS